MFLVAFRILTKLLASATIMPRLALVVELLRQLRLSIVLFRHTLIEMVVTTRPSGLLFPRLLCPPTIPNVLISVITVLATEVAWALLLVRTML